MCGRGARGGSPEVEGLEGGEGGERRGQRRGAFGADVVPTATKRGTRRGGGSGSARSAADGAEVMIAAGTALVWWG